MHREKDGAVHFWRIKQNLHNQSPQSFIGVVLDGKHFWQHEEERKEDSSIVLMFSEQLFLFELFKDIQVAILLIFHYRTMLYSEQLLPVYFPYWMCVQSAYYHELWINTWRSKFEQVFRALQCHSGWSLIDPTLQDNVLIPDGFLTYIFDIGCAINLHSIIHLGLILGGQNLNRQTVFFPLVDPMDKNHEDPDTIDLNEPRFIHNAWKRSEHNVLDRHQSCSEQKIEVLSDSIHVQHMVFRKFVKIETGVVKYEKVFVSLRPPPKISLNHDRK